TDLMALPLRERLIQTADHYFRNMESFDLETGLTGRTADCILKVLPASFGMPDRTNEECMAAHIATRADMTMKNFKAWRVPGSIPIVDEANRKVVFHMEIYAEMGDGVYHNEFIFIMTTNDEGTLLKEVAEYVDTAAEKKFAAERMARTKGS
uniref:Crystal structure of aldolase AtoB complex with substrate analogue n=3 Tax=Aspergillus ochraceus TaxID=40380 RepID=A0AC62AEB8_9EURO